MRSCRRERRGPLLAGTNDSGLRTAGTSALSAAPGCASLGCPGGAVCEALGLAGPRVPGTGTLPVVLVGPLPAILVGPVGEGRFSLPGRSAGVSLGYAGSGPLDGVGNEFDGPVGWWRGEGPSPPLIGDCGLLTPG